MIYLAGPIDQAPPDDLPLRLRVHTALASRGLPVYNPQTAFSRAADDPAGVVNINTAALLRCRAVLALVPAGVPSVGTPMEIQLAKQHGVPVRVIGGAGSLQLIGMGVPIDSETDEGVSRAVSWAEMHQRGGDRATAAAFAPRPEKGQDGHAEPQAARAPLPPALRWTGDGAAPTRSFPGDAGFDLKVSEAVWINSGSFAEVKCGIQIEMPPGVWGLITGRSSTWRRHGLHVENAVIDQGYRGDLYIGVHNPGGRVKIKRGVRLAQLIPLPCVADRLEVQYATPGTLSPSVRGSAGFGSTGR